VFSINDRIRGHKYNWLEHVERMEEGMHQQTAWLGPKEEGILPDHIEGGIHRSRKRTAA
jgi:hypothetical protein